MIIGANLGGLGTLIASMASLISFKALAHAYNEKKGKYFLVFTLMNVIYQGILLEFCAIIRYLQSCVNFLLTQAQHN